MGKLCVKTFQPLETPGDKKADKMLHENLQKVVNIFSTCHSEYF